MEFLGIGAPELIFILVLVLIILGPADMQKTGRTIGQWLNRMVNSEGWRAFQRTSREIRNLPTTLMRNANLDDIAETGRSIENAIDPNWNRRPPGRPSVPSSQAPAPVAPPDTPDAGTPESSSPAAGSPDDAEPDA